MRPLRLAVLIGITTVPAGGGTAGGWFSEGRGLLLATSGDSCRPPAGTSHGHQRRLFHGHGQPWHPDYFGDRFRSLVEAAGLPRIRVHDTRHTACSLMVQSGVPVKVVQELAGHASPAITMALYVHTVPSMGRQAGEELTARLLG